MRVEIEDDLSGDEAIFRVHLRWSLAEQDISFDSSSYLPANRHSLDEVAVYIWFSIYKTVL
jgi:hypothetical protein